MFTNFATNLITLLLDYFMLFNSIEFAIFLPIVFIIYWFVFGRSIKAQNGLMLIASYVFYGWWDWRFLSLIVFSTLIDYRVGIALSRQSALSKRKILLLTSVFVNLGFLGFFKYYNFFVDSFVQSFSLLGQSLSVDRLSIILPVGISFYTFQTLSYSIDVYRGRLEPTKDLIAFGAFVSFFPQLVAGPIERATNLLPQFYKKRFFSYEKSVDGLRQILWGIFKKVIIADNCAYYANQIFNNYEDYSGVALLVGAVCFAFQIYGDFSGYSDIAIGTSRLFGFDLMRNFAFPYFSRDIGEFWRSWHISLSTWFRDYLYIPLGGSKGGTWLKLRNTFIIFLVSGFWHGANWTFVAWGFIHACYFVPLLLLGKNRKNLDIVACDSSFPRFKEIAQMGVTFCLVTVAWIFFRADSIGMAVDYIYSMFTSFYPVSFYELKSIALGNTTLWHVFFVGMMLLLEWINRDQQHALQLNTTSIPTVVRWGMYYAIGFSIFYFQGGQQDFIYFQF